MRGEIVDESIINELVNNQKIIMEKIDYIFNNLPIKKYLSIKEYATKVGRSNTYVYQHPWLIPNFGESNGVDDSRKNKRWSMEEWEEWEKIPLDERKKTYQEKCAREAKLKRMV